MAANDRRRITAIDFAQLLRVLCPLTLNYGVGVGREGTRIKPSLTVPSYGALASDYARYRPSYPDTVYYRMRKALEGRMNLAIDVGAGTGQVTRSLQNWFGSVLAVEPDAELLQFIDGTDVVSTRQCSAEELECPPYGADAIVCGSTLHWLDVDRFAANVRQMLAPGGVLLVFGYGPPQYHHTSKAASDTLKEQSALWREFIPTQLLDWAPYDGLLADTDQFSSIEAYECYAEHDWAMTELVGFNLTTSYGAAYKAAQPDPEGYHSRLTDRLEQENHSGKVRVRFPIEVALARID